MSKIVDIVAFCGGRIFGKGEWLILKSHVFFRNLRALRTEISLNSTSFFMKSRRSI